LLPKLGSDGHGNFQWLWLETSLKITRMICLLLLSLIALVGSVGSESYNFLLFYFWNLGLRIVLE
jgi:hypothetical protein